LQHNIGKNMNDKNNRREYKYKYKNTTKLFDIDPCSR